jgi:hypothetical protein
MTFGDISVGSNFLFMGKHYQKIADLSIRGLNGWDSVANCVWLCEHGDENPPVFTLEYLTDATPVELSAKLYCYEIYHENIMVADEYITSIAAQDEKHAIEIYREQSGDTSDMIFAEKRLMQ